MREADFGCEEIRGVERMRKLPMVMVEWEDTCSSGNWSSDEEAHIRTLVIKSVGFLLKDTEDLVSICQSQDDVEKKQLRG